MKQISIFLKYYFSPMKRKIFLFISIILWVLMISIISSLRLLINVNLVNEFLVISINRVWFAITLGLNALIYSLSSFNLKKKDNLLMIRTTKITSIKIIIIHLSETSLLFLFFYLIPSVALFENINIYTPIEFFVIIVSAFIQCNLYLLIIMLLDVCIKNRKNNITLKSIVTFCIFVVSLIFIPSNYILEGWAWSKYFLFINPFGWMNMMFHIGYIPRNEIVIFGSLQFVFSVFIMGVSIYKLNKKIFKGEICLK